MSPPKEQLHRVNQSADNTFALRVLQHTALHHLRTIKHCSVDDSQLFHALAGEELASEQFVDVTTEQCAQLKHIVTALSAIEDQKAVAPTVLLRALTAEQHAAYIASYDTAYSHAEDELGAEMPDELRKFADYVKDGDRYNALANRARRAKKQTRDEKGRTTSERMSYKAETCYESALTELARLLEGLPGMLFDSALANRVRQWIDRPVSTMHGDEAGADCERVPRIRGSKSKFTLMSAEPMWGARLKKYWRQREAVVTAALPLLFGVAAKNELDAASTARLRAMMQKLKAASD